VGNDLDGIRAKFSANAAEGEAGQRCDGGDERHGLDEAP